MFRKSIFFFSSRRRHTRCSRDWSSDVCSSDLGFGRLAAFLYGWCLFLVIASGSVAALARVFSEYFAQVVPISPVLQTRSEEHTSELQSRLHLVCRLLLEKKKK